MQRRREPTTPAPERLSIFSRVTDLLDAGETTQARHLFAVFLITLSSLGFSFGGLIMRSFENADPWQINFYRSLFLVGVLGAILVRQYGRQSFAVFRPIGKMGIVAGICIGVAPIAYVISLRHTTVANTLFVISAVPFFTAALAWLFLGERVRRGTWVAMIIALVGIGVMVAGGVTAGTVFGNAMALCTALTFSCFAVIVRAHRRLDMLPTLIIGGIVTLLICFGVTYRALWLSMHDILLCLLWGGLIAGLIGNWLFALAARHLPAVEVTLLMLTEFVLGPIWVWLFINEVPDGYTILGGMLVMAAVAGRALADMRSRVVVGGI